MGQPQKAKFVATVARRGLSGQVGELADAIKTGAELDLVQSRYCIYFLRTGYFVRFLIYQITYYNK